MSIARSPVPALVSLGLLALSGCGTGASSPGAGEVVEPDRATEPVTGLAASAFVAAPDGFQWFTNDEDRGLDRRGADGRSRATLGGPQWTDVDARAGVALSEGEGRVLVSVDEDARRPRLFTAAPEGEWEPRDLRGLEEPGFAPDAACLYHDEGEGRLYLFLTDGDGGAAQWLIAFDGDGARAHRVRDLPLGGETAGCTVDDATGRLYVAEEGVGVWGLNAHPERALQRSPLAMTAPWGRLDEPVDVAVHRASGTVVVADEGDGRLHLYRQGDGRYLGAVRPGRSAAVEAVAATALAAEGLPAGAVAVSDEAGGRYALLDWRRIADAVGIEPGETVPEPRSVPAVAPTVATEPVASAGDAADDPAIWVHPDAPEKSLILGTDKRGGLYVYDLQGRERQYLPDGRLNNVDLRTGFELGGERVALVAATNRSDDTLALYRVDPQERRLERVSVVDGPLTTGFEESYGLCMYHDPERDRHYVIANDKEGRVHQWELTGRGDAVAAERVRAFEVGSQTEGCVADDEHGHLFIGEEAVAIWRYAADPAGGTERVAVDRADGGHFTADVEGLALYAREDGTGFLVASSQGDDRFTVYRRTGDHAYVGDFRIGLNPDAGLDGASETDGIEVVSAPLGADYPAGLMVAQDGRNLMLPRNQNYKLVSWEAIRSALPRP
jgi:3-phytase